MLVVYLFIAALIIFKIGNWVYKWQWPKYNGKVLPPGSMGLPLIGETFQFFTPCGFDNIPPFIQTRMERYGPLFRTSLLGKKVIVSTDADVNYYILRQENKSFVQSFTESVTNILGEVSHGSLHKYIRNSVLRHFGADNIKKNLLDEMSDTIRTLLHSWASNGAFDVKELAAQISFRYAAKKLMSYEEAKSPINLTKSYQAFSNGLISFPLNIPGTAYHACKQGRKTMIKVIKNIVQERRRSKNEHSDFLDQLLEDMEDKETGLNEMIIINLVFVLLFAASETTSTTIAVAMKLMNENPSVLAELTKEHDAIIRNKDDDSAELTWEDYRSMTFTHMVINETLRLSNTVPVLFRKAITDVEVKGYTIPAGWLVLVIPTTVHLDADKYENPYVFDPWRWKDKELHAGSRTFMAFGGGTRLCAGAEFSKALIAVFLHHLVRHYRWKVHACDITRTPALMFQNELRVEILEKRNFDKHFRHDEQKNTIAHIHV